VVVIVVLLGVARSVHHEAAVHRQQLAGDEACQIRQREHYRAAHVLGLLVARQRTLLAVQPVAVLGLPVLWFGEPTGVDRRLVTQSGLFVMPVVLDRSIDSILDGYPATGREPLIVKYVLPIGMRPHAMNALYRMNVTCASLFPDIEGLARATAYELEVIWERLDHELRQRADGPQ
jgi:hypothetical protein